MSEDTLPPRYRRGNPGAPAEAPVEEAAPAEPVVPASAEATAPEPGYVDPLKRATSERIPRERKKPGRKPGPQPNRKKPTKPYRTRVNSVPAGGAVTTFTDELAAYICGEIANGKPLRAICKPDTMPTVHTVHNWINSNAKFKEAYLIAKDDCADALIDEMLYIADNDGKVGSTGKIFRDKLRVDVRKWYASKLKPKAYGDRMAVTGEGGGPVTIEIVRFSDMKPSGTPSASNSTP